MLARRLINQQSISIDSEEFMVTKLKVCSKDYFERKTLMESYRIGIKMQRLSSEVRCFPWVLIKDKSQKIT